MGNLNFEKKYIEYHIMNKDEIVGKIIWNEITNQIIEIEYIRMPDFIKKRDIEFIYDRTPPKHRKHMIELLEQLELNNIKAIIDYSRGLSLTDTFWIKPKDKKLKWKDINLYENDFSETIAKIAFEGGLFGEKFSTTTPELSTDGNLPKCWYRDKKSKIITLKKKGSFEECYNPGKEPVSEYLASQILDVLKYPHINYTIEYYENRKVSSCPLITNQSISLAPVAYFASDLNSLIDFCEKNDFIDDLYRIFIFDYIIYNVDRHLRNIGVLFDSETYELISLAPIYDNGQGLLYNYTIDGEDNKSFEPWDIKDYLSNKKPVLYSDWDYSTAKFKSALKLPHNIEKLLNFKFEEHPLVDNKRLKYLEKFVQERARKFLNLKKGLNLSDLN